MNLRRHTPAAGDGAQPEMERAFRGEAVELPAFGYDLSSVASGKGQGPRSAGSTKLVPWVEENGRVAGVYAFHQPRAERNRSGPLSESGGQEALLTHSIDAAKRMVRRVTHYFNNLIVAVCGYASVHEGRHQLDQDSKELAGLIGQGGSQLAGLTDHLARFADNPSHDRTRLNLNHIVTALLDQGRGCVPEDVEVRVDLGSPMPGLLGDQAQLSAVCWNLWQNAIESMPQGGELLCQTSTLWARDATRSHQGDGDSTRYVRLRVSDTGDGMDADARAGMFDPFFTTKAGKGRGLGATVLYEAVRSHGGHIEVYSAPGAGTCVDLYFPAEGEAAGQPSLSHGPTGHGSRPRLLVVDDDDMVRMAIERMLAHLGYRSLVAASGEEALVIYEQSRADIASVILDITMPGLGGIETFRRLRQIDSRVKMIVSSGDPLNPAIRQIEAQGISYMIPKPFHAEQLARAIQQTLEAPPDFRRGAREENRDS